MVSAILIFHLSINSTEQITNWLNKFISVIIVLTLFFQALAFLVPGIHLRPLNPEDIIPPHCIVFFLLVIRCHLHLLKAAWLDLSSHSLRYSLMCSNAAYDCMLRLCAWTDLLQDVLLGDRCDHRLLTRLLHLPANNELVQHEVRLLKVEDYVQLADLHSQHVDTKQTTCF